MNGGRGTNTQSISGQLTNYHPEIRKLTAVSTLATDPFTTGKAKPWLISSLFVFPGPDVPPGLRYVKSFGKFTQIFGVCKKLLLPRSGRL